MYKKRFFILATVFTIIMYFICMYNDNQYKMATAKISTLQDSLSVELDNVKNLSIDLDAANDTINGLKGAEYELLYIGEYKISHYCVEEYDHICGNGDGKTATGTSIKPGRTIAVDSQYIPYGSSVYIEGYGWRVAEDCGGAIRGKHIDMAVDTHDYAMKSGIRHTGVWLLVKKS